MSGAAGLGAPNATAIGFFVLFVALTLGITWWAARRTRTTEEFFAAGRRISGRQNGFALAASGNFPALVLSIFWRGFTTAGAVAAIVTGTLLATGLIWLSPTIQIDILQHDSAWFPLKNPAIVSMPLAFVVAVLVSLAWPEQAARDGYEAKERRMILGE